jgi:hypothetical protein
MYDPISDGEGGVRGGCKRCYALLGIYQQHKTLMTSLREFGASAERKRREIIPAANQPSLFE